MGLPELSAEDRAAAADAALAARRRRAEIKADLAAGSLSLSEVIDMADADPAVAKLRVSDMLAALPRIGPVRAEAIMGTLGIAPTRRMRGLGERQRRALLAHFEGM